jgi:preprotein translocase subunit Sss1
MNKYYFHHQLNTLTIPDWTNRLFLLLFFFIQIILIFIFAEKGLSLIIILFLAFILFFYTAFSVERMFYLFTFYIAIAPDTLYLKYFPGFPISYTFKFAIPLFALVLFYWIIYLFKAKEQTNFKSLDYAILAYLVFVILSAVRGFFYGFKLLYFVWDLLSHLWYLGYFIFRYSPLRLNIKKFYDVILFFVFIISLEFIYGFTHTEGFIVFRRVVAKNIHLALFGISYIGATIIYGTTRSRKIVFAMILPIIIFAVLTCQQRSLWLSTILSILILACIFIYSRRHWITKNLKQLLKIMLIGILVISVIFFIVQNQTKLFLTIITRILIFINPSLLKYDLSWLIREREIATVLQDFGNQLLFGRGFGASIVSPDRHFILSAPDNAYVYLFWKMGITGLLSFIIIQYLFIRKCFLILHRTERPDEKIFALTGLLNTFGLIIVGFANTCIAQYEYLIIWTAIMAAIATVAHQYE